MSIDAVTMFTMVKLFDACRTRLLGFNGTQNDKSKS